MNDSNQRKARKTCRIVGAGPGRKLFSRTEGELILAADGGYDYMTAEGISPDYVIGDFDSAENVPSGENVIPLPKEKDDTDILAAIRFGMEKGCTEFFLYRALGGRFSHSISNVQCLKYLRDNGLHGRIVTDDGWVEVVAAGDRLEVVGDGYISVFAFSPNSVVTLNGFKYPLDNYLMTDSFPIGVSNRVKDKVGVIECASGTLLVVTETI